MSDLRLLTGDARIIFDIGAAEGRITQSYLDMFPKAVVYAFEPTPGVFKLAKHPRVRFHCTAVMDKNGTTTFRLNTKRHTNSVLPFTAKFKLASTKQVIKIPAVTLDTFCKSRKIGRIDILKIDVQGVELLVLKGAARLFAENAVKVVFVELQHAPVYKGQSRRQQIGKFLSRHGFRLDSEQPTYRGDKLIHSNGVFVKQFHR